MCRSPFPAPGTARVAGAPATRCLRPAPDQTRRRSPPRQRRTPPPPGGTEMAPHPHDRCLAPAPRHQPSLSPVHGIRQGPTHRSHAQGLRPSCRATRGGPPVGLASQWAVHPRRRRRDPTAPTTRGAARRVTRPRAPRAARGTATLVALHWRRRIADAQRPTAVHAARLLRCPPRLHPARHARPRSPRSLHLYRPLRPPSGGPRCVVQLRCRRPPQLARACHCRRPARSHRWRQTPLHRHCPLPPRHHDGACGTNRALLAPPTCHQTQRCRAAPQSQPARQPADSQDQEQPSRVWTT